eukprot:1187677-Prorocentrum_minimum.AAC.3
MSATLFLSGRAVIGMVEPTRVEPDGTAMNLKDSMSESEWKANVSEWDAWSVAFTESVWPDERKFYFFKKQDRESVTCVEEYPESCRMAFQVLLPGIGARSKTSRGKLRVGFVCSFQSLFCARCTLFSHPPVDFALIEKLKTSRVNSEKCKSGLSQVTPYGLELIVINGPGQHPPLLEDKIPMGSVKGWRLFHDGGMICIYVQTSKVRETSADTSNRLCSWNADRRRLAMLLRVTHELRWSHDDA